MRKLSIVMVVLLVLSVGALAGTEIYQMQHTDDTLPVIDCPAEPLVIQVGENSAEKLLDGVTAWDEKDGDLTGAVMVESVGKSVEDGQTTLIYAVSDSDAHVTKAVRTVIWSDYEPPRFALSQELRYAVGAPVLVHDRVTARDVVDGDISERVKVTATGLNNYTEGVYPVTFEVTNSLGDTSRWEAEIVIQNWAPGEPRIYLTEYLVYLPVGAEFSPNDYLEGVLYGDAAQVTASTDLDTQTPGTYTVLYSCPGSSGVSGTARLYVIVEE